MCAAEYNGFVVVSVVVSEGVGGVGGCGFEMDVDGIAVFSIVNILWLFFDNGGVIGWCDRGELSGIDRCYEGKGGENGGIKGAEVGEAVFADDDDFHRVW